MPDISIDEANAGIGQAERLVAAMDQVLSDQPDA
jgi:hypothetical protein